MGRKKKKTREKKITTGIPGNWACANGSLPGAHPPIIFKKIFSALTKYKYTYRWCVRPQLEHLLIVDSSTVRPCEYSPILIYRCVRTSSRKHACLLFWKNHPTMFRVSINLRNSPSRTDSFFTNRLPALTRRDAMLNYWRMFFVFVLIFFGNCAFHEYKAVN